MMRAFIKFDGYVVGANKIQEVQKVLMSKFWLTSDKIRDYDPEGHFRAIKARYSN